MTDQPAIPPTNQQLDEISARAAALNEYAVINGVDGQATLDELTGTDVPQLVAEVRRLRAELAIIRRWIVPAAEPWGAAAAEIGKAWAVAERAYREHFEIPDERPLHDDALRFHVREGEIVIEFQDDARAG